VQPIIATARRIDSASVFNEGMSNAEKAKIPIDRMDLPVFISNTTFGEAPNVRWSASWLAPFPNPDLTSSGSDRIIVGASIKKHFVHFWTIYRRCEGRRL
jgi:hypothetical protein